MENLKRVRLGFSAVDIETRVWNQMWAIHGPPTEFTSKKHLAFVEKLVSCPTGQKQMVSRLTTRHQIAGVVDLELHPSVQAAKEELFNIFWWLSPKSPDRYKIFKHK